MSTRAMKTSILPFLVGIHLCLLPAAAQTSSVNAPQRLVDEIRLDATIVAKLAATLATTLANNEAKKRFDTEPFLLTNTTATFHGDRWEWQATAGYGKGDLRATVSFKQDGSEPKVEITTLVNERSTTP